MYVYYIAAAILSVVCCLGACIINTSQQIITVNTNEAISDMAFQVVNALNEALVLDEEIALAGENIDDNV